MSPEKSEARSQLLRELFFIFQTEQGLLREQMDKLGDVSIGMGRLADAVAQRVQALQQGAVEGNLEEALLIHRLLVDTSRKYLENLVTIRGKSAGLDRAQGILSTYQAAPKNEADSNPEEEEEELPEMETGVPQVE